MMQQIQPHYSYHLHSTAHVSLNTFDDENYFWNFNVDAVRKKLVDKIELFLKNDLFR